MIVILTQKNDISTIEVEKWIEKINPKVTVEKIFSGDIDNLLKALSYKDINSIWFRRWEYYPPLDIIERNLFYERNSIFEYFQFLNKDVFWLNEPSKTEISKLVQLQIAQDVKLYTPKTKLLSNKKELKLFFNECSNKLVTKPIQEKLRIQESQNKTLFSYTKLLQNEDINLIPNKFFPSLFQEYIISDYEVRTFFLDGLFYSMAIISLDDSEINVDVRYNNALKKNRFISYSLPQSIEDKLKIFFEKISINSGSVDILVKNNKHYFLEVNPVGQFDMLSSPCNYNIEKLIAQKLVYYDKIC